MTRTISRFQPLTPGSARTHGELHIADLDAIVGGGQIAPMTQQAGATKTPNLLVVIAIIAILIG